MDLIRIPIKQMSWKKLKDNQGNTYIDWIPNNIKNDW